LKNERLFQIIYILLEKKTITAPLLAKLLEVSVRTVYRDIASLSMAGVPVYAAAGKGGGISLMSGYTFDKTLLTDEEQSQLLFAIQSLQAADLDLDALRLKLGSVFQKNSTNWIEVDFSRWGYRRTDSVKFELLKQAILERRILQLLYYSASGEASERELKPIKLIFKDKAWYLQAFCMRAQDFRLFKINRMINISVSETQYSDDFSHCPPLERDALPLVHSVFLQLQFSPLVAFRVYDEFDLNSIQQQEDGSLTVCTNFPLDQWLLSYLFSFGTELRIISPSFLREELTDYAKKIYEHHKS